MGSVTANRRPSSLEKFNNEMFRFAQHDKDANNNVLALT
jgi:hypothetical protein